MKRRPTINQSGFALLVFVLAIMGAGGLLLVGFSEGMLDAAESKKFEHNKRVLEEAKQALLQFTYNYPVTNNGGPGRLPCADIDNDGDANDNDDADNDVTTDNGECITLGRLPWNEPNLNFYDIRDADGQRLWYAVSDAFATNVSGGNIINSDASGTITIRDQSGYVIHNGSNPGALTQYGIAAVIIAPGAIIDRNGVTQDRSIANADDPFDTTADTDPGIITAANYLDLVNGTDDNATYTQDSATDGFILGPVNDTTNDQFIVITAAEVIEMAEKAAMQAYRTAISDYRVNSSYCDGESPDGATTEAACLAAATPGTWTLGPYPWLYNYAGVTDIADMSSYYPADASWATELATNLTTIGRIPTMFGDKSFTETDSQPIETNLSGSIGITIPEDVGCTGCDKAFTYNDDEFKFNDFATVKTPIFPEDQILTDARFVDLATAGEGRLTGNSATAVSGTLEMWFWDDDDSETEIYTPCGDDGNGIPELTDCNRDSSGNPKPGGTNDEKSIILRIEVSFDFPYAAGVVKVDMDYSTPPPRSQLFLLPVHPTP